MSIFQGVDTKRGGLQTIPFLNQPKGAKIQLIDWGWVVVPGRLALEDCGGGTFDHGDSAIS